MSGLGMFGAFAGGAATGYATGEKLKIERDASQRAQEEHTARMDEAAAAKRKREDADAFYQAGADITAKYLNGGKAPAAAPVAPAGPLAQPPADANPLPSLKQPTGVMPGDTSYGLGTGGDGAPVQAPNTPSQPGPVDQAAAPSLGMFKREMKSEVDGPKSADHAIGYGLFSRPQLFENPDYLNEMAQAAQKFKQPEYMKWLESGYKASKENAIPALHLLQEGQPQQARQMFEQRGVKLASDPEDLGGGKWNVTYENGKSEVVEPTKMLRSLYNPKEWSKMQLEAAQTDKAKNEARMYGSYADNLDAGRTRDGKPTDPAPKAGAGGKEPKPEGRENLPVHKELNDLAEKAYGEYDPISGKYKYNSNVTLAASNAARVWNGNQHLDAATAFQISSQGKPTERIQREVDANGKVTRVFAIPYMEYQGKTYPMDGNDPAANRRDVTKDAKYARYLNTDAKAAEAPKAGAKQPVKRNTETKQIRGAPGLERQASN